MRKERVKIDILYETGRVESKKQMERMRRNQGE